MNSHLTFMTLSVMHFPVVDASLAAGFSLLALGTVLALLLLSLRLLRGRQSVARVVPAPPLITSRTSPNFDNRAVDGPTFLILHYTAMDTAEAALDRLCDPAAKVSAHYLVDEAGKIYNLVPEAKRAWHAGVSYWGGFRDLNSGSIGIEIANQGDRPFTQPQMESVKQLCLWILSRYNIPANQVLGHSDIAPGRKPDPGPLFDWQGLAAQGIGLWPTPDKQDYDKSAGWQNTQFRAALSRYGYSPDPDMATIVNVFQRHFQEDVFNTPDKVGVINPEASARLAWLLRHKG
jgi:N-acetylmuramoyl-L-alanine amidase